MLRHWIGVTAVALLLVGCEETDLCQGEPPYDGACVCNVADGSTAMEGYRDRDADGYGSAVNGYWCGGGFATRGDDCDDNDPTAYPEDRDGDGASGCDEPPDCADDDPTIHPGADEVCDGEDNDCDGEAPGEEDEDGDGYPICADDCDDTDPLVTPGDQDGDGASGCDDPPDCDDGDASLTPVDGDGDGASTCDGDCDDTDAALNVDDADGDGSTTCDGDEPDGDGSTTCDGDCDDADPLREALDADGDGFTTCDGDCDDGDDELTLLDLDNDGYTPCDGDCNDFNDDVDPADLDGDLYSTCDGDCDDGDPTVFPEETTSTGWSRDCAPWVRADLDDDDWYGHRVEDPAVIYDGTMLGLLYLAEDPGGLSAIGLYFTDDMVLWQDAGGPILEDTGVVDDWDGQGLSGPHAVYDPIDVDNPYKLYFAATHPVEGTTEIGLAVSVDGFSWTRYQDQGVPPATLRAIGLGAAGELDEVTAAAPYVWVDGDDYGMLYTCSNTFATGICLATSEDRGYTWTKWDPAPGEGMDPEPLLIPGGVGDWDELDVGHPAWIDTDALRMLVYGGDSAAGWASGVAHAPFGLQGPSSKLDSLSPVLAASTQAGRWDALHAVVGDGWEDGGQVSVFYAGAMEDASVPGGEVVQIGRLVGERPDVLLTEPAADPHAMTTADAVTFAGWLLDEGPLDEVLLVISSEIDDGVQLTGYADPTGDFSVEAPGGTFVDDPSPYVVTVSAYDAGGLAGVTSVTLDVSP